MRNTIQKKTPAKMMKTFIEHVSKSYIELLNVRKSRYEKKSFILLTMKLILRIYYKRFFFIIAFIKRKKMIEQKEFYWSIVLLQVTTSKFMDIWNEKNLNAFMNLEINALNFAEYLRIWADSSLYVFWLKLGEALVIGNFKVFFKIFYCNWNSYSISHGDQSSVMDAW